MRTEAGRGAARRGAPRDTVADSIAGVPLRAEDALFLHAETPLLCQQVGAVLLLEPAPIQVDDLRSAIGQRMRAVPELRRRLERPPNRWRRPRWIPDDDTGPGERIRQVMLGENGTPGRLDDAVDAFFTARCDPCHRPWEMLFVRGVPAGRTAIVVKVHHTLGDSHTLIATLGKLFDPVPAATGAAVLVRAPEGRGLGLRPRLRGAARAGRGLCYLAAAGHAPATSVCGPFTSGRRRFIPLALPAREVAMTARSLHASIADLLLAAIAEAVRRLLRSRGEQMPGGVIRTAVPRARPVPAGRGKRPLGNRSAAVSLDLPIGPMSLAERLTAVRGRIDTHLRHGEPEAAGLVLRAMNLLPPPVQRRTAAQLYQRRWFSMLVSIFPGARRSHRVLGAGVEEVYPVLALADGVGLAIGAMTWERSLSVGILADAALVPDAGRLAAELTGAFERYRAAAGSQGAGTAGIGSLGKR